MVDTVQYTTPDGVTLWVRNTTYDDDRYSNDEVRTYDIGTEPLKTVLDIGAHIGAFTCWVKHLHPEAEIEAVEPEAENFEVLLRNIEGLSGVAATNAFMGDESSEEMFVVIHDSHTTCHRVVPKSAVRPGEKIVKAVPGAARIEAIMAVRGWERLSLMKVDCEGCELDLFRHTSDEVIQRIDRIVGEQHNGYENFMLTIGARLQALGFEVTGQQDPKAHSTFLAVNRHRIRLQINPETSTAVTDAATISSYQFDMVEQDTISVSGEADLPIIELPELFTEEDPSPATTKPKRKTASRKTKGKPARKNALK